MYKTRSAAATACRNGRVSINSTPARPARLVRIGDRVEAQVDDHQRVLEVVRLIEKRVAPSIAAECVVDYSPPRPVREFNAPLFARDPGAGRPTKKDRRMMERFRNR